MARGEDGSMEMSAFDVAATDTPASTAIVRIITRWFFFCCGRAFASLPEPGKPIGRLRNLSENARFCAKMLGSCAKVLDILGAVPIEHPLEDGFHRSFLREDVEDRSKAGERRQTNRGEEPN